MRHTAMLACLLSLFAMTVNASQSSGAGAGKVSIGKPTAAINPQPLPPRSSGVHTAINPQPLPPHEPPTVDRQSQAMKGYIGETEKSTPR